MAKFQLTISSGYVADWGVYEGVRELLQNALDGEQDGHELQINHHDGKLSVTNLGVRLQRNVWLLGQTSKEGGDYRGHFGEGLKLGALALTRAGRQVRIINDDETWVVSLQPSDTFGLPVLTVHTRQCRSATGRFTVEVDLTAEEWAEYQTCFLRLTPARRAIPTRYGQILLDPEKAGRCYVKGIFVEHKDHMAAGYDFSSAGTDRDRRMINSFDFSFYAAHSWADAFQENRVTAEEVYSALENNGPDAKGLGDYTMPTAMVDALSRVFRERYGLEAIPVSDNEELRLVAHYGKQGVLCSKTVHAFFKKHPEFDLDALRSKVRANTLETYTLSSLSSHERHVYQRGVAMVEEAARSLGYASTLGRLEIVRFHDHNLLGAHVQHDHLQPATLRIARRCLADMEGFLLVFVHELAHDNGADGDVEHERAEGRLFSRILCQQLQLDATPRQLIAA